MTVRSSQKLERLNTRTHGEVWCPFLENARMSSDYSVLRGAFKEQQHCPIFGSYEPSQIYKLLFNLNGITIQAHSNPGQSEEVVSITYGPAQKDSRLRCN
jgi:hypothetical protein